MHLKMVEAQAARDSLAMTVYNKLFGWLVESINGLLKMHKESRAMIGLILFECTLIVVFIYLFHFFFFFF